MAHLFLPFEMDHFDAEHHQVIPNEYCIDSRSLDGAQRQNGPFIFRLEMGYFGIDGNVRKHDLSQPFCINF